MYLQPYRPLVTTQQVEPRSFFVDFIVTGSNLCSILEMLKQHMLSVFFIEIFLLRSLLANQILKSHFTRCVKQAIY